MAFQFVAVAHVGGNPVSSLTVNKPSGTVDGDIIFAFGKHLAPLTGTPSGWIQDALADDVASGSDWFLYHKVASSEPADYTWTWGSSSRGGITNITYRDGFDTADPIDVVSNTDYETNDTTNRAASMIVSAINSPLIFFCGIHASASQTHTPPTNPATFAEDLDTWINDGSRFGREIASVIWSGSGATGDMDATINTANTAKHAFAVALNPAAGGGGGGGIIRRGLLTMGVGRAPPMYDCDPSSGILLRRRRLLVPQPTWGKAA